MWEKVVPRVEQAFPIGETIFFPVSISLFHLIVLPLQFKRKKLLNLTENDK